MTKKIPKILKDLPHSPGIYKFIDANKDIIYIGKAKDLSKRVKQYFQKKQYFKNDKRYFIYYFKLNGTVTNIVGGKQRKKEANIS